MQQLKNSKAKMSYRKNIVRQFENIPWFFSQKRLIAKVCTLCKRALGTIRGTNVFTAQVPQISVKLVIILILSFQHLTRYLQVQFAPIPTESRHTCQINNHAAGLLLQNNSLKNRSETHRITVSLFSVHLIFIFLFPFFCFFYIGDARKINRLGSYNSYFYQQLITFEVILQYH